MEDLLKPTEIVEFDKEKYQKNIEENTFEEEEMNGYGSLDYREELEI